MGLNIVVPSKKQELMKFVAATNLISVKYTLEMILNQQSVYGPRIQGQRIRYFPICLWCYAFPICARLNHEFPLPSTILSIFLEISSNNDPTFKMVKRFAKRRCICQRRGLLYSFFVSVVQI